MPSSERALISKIRRIAGYLPATSASRKLLRKTGDLRLVTGIGDDCAVLRATGRSDLLVTTDFSLEGVHFRRDWHPPEFVGHRCLARGLSDIAAMGGEPVAAFLSLAVPDNLSQAWIDRFLDGFLRLARKFGVRLAGGDTSQSTQGVLADVIVIGSISRGQAILRSGAKPGDRIYVTGSLGESASALKLFYSKKKVDSKRFPRHFLPIPRIEVARILRMKNIPTSMIDLSDGLSTDLSHLCEESHIGAEVNSAAIPIAQTGPKNKSAAFHLALHGGEDYELLFTAPPGIKVSSRIAHVSITCIGEITRGQGMFLSDANGRRSRLKPLGWEHFRAPQPTRQKAK